jgi:Zn-dependent protease with chaperone function
MPSFGGEGTAYAGGVSDQAGIVTSTDGDGPRYPGISAKAYEHPADRAATSALATIPLLDKVIKRLADLSYERRLRQILTGDAVRIGEAQVPSLWRSFETAGRSLDLATLPQLYVTQEPWVNAMTIGANGPLVVMSSPLAGNYAADEVHAVLGHELAHVLSEHVYYTTVLWTLWLFLRGNAPKPLVGLPMRGIYLVLLEWSRAAELSSDRASALVAGDPLVPSRMLMRLAGGAIEGMSVEAFIAQANEYHDEVDPISRWGRFWIELGLTHPFAVRRVHELFEWVRSGEYDRIRSGSYPIRGSEPPPTAEFSAAVDHYRERFLRVVDTVTGGVQRMASQLDDWLQRTDDR